MLRVFRRNILSYFFVSISSLVVLAQTAGAYVLAPSSNIIHEAVSESVPTAFTLNDWAAADFILEWSGAPLSGVKWGLGKNSLEWVRVSDLLVIPRARFMLEVSGYTAGTITNDGFVQPLAPLNTSPAAPLAAQIPLALLHGEPNLITLTLIRQGVTVTGQISVRLKPRVAPAIPQLYTDTSCSSFGVKLEGVNLDPSLWVTAGCRMLYSEGHRYRTPSLEVLLVIDGVGQNVTIAGVPTQASHPFVWPLRLRSSQSKIDIVTKRGNFTLSYFIPEKLNLAFVGAGLGPYNYAYNSPDVNSYKGIVPVLTLYSSYFISETMRLVAFDAFTINKHYFNDFGIYLNSEYLRILDKRVIVNIMLGANIRNFPMNGKQVFKFGGPQGFEIIYRDAFKRTYNMSIGSFIYPLIAGKSYYNLWLRWGKSSLFFEFNYIGWEEATDAGAVSSRSTGICIGMPLFRFL